MFRVLFNRLFNFHGVLICFVFVFMQLLFDF